MSDEAEKLAVRLKNEQFAPGCNGLVVWASLANSAAAMIRAQAAEIRRLRANRERLERSLTWYGENARLARLAHTEGDAGRSNIAEDGGRRARAAQEEGGWMRLRSSSVSGTTSSG